MITPRKNELEAVTAVLESEDFDSSQDMAKAIVRALATELGSVMATAWLSGSARIACGWHTGRISPSWTRSGW